jgi:hypothetical protein
VNTERNTEAEAAGSYSIRIGQGDDVDGDDAELLCPIEFDCIAEQTESCIVDDELDLHIFRGQRVGNFVAGIGMFEVARDQNRRRAASGDDFARQAREAIPASVNQGQSMVDAKRLRTSGSPDLLQPARLLKGESARHEALLQRALSKIDEVAPIGTS